MTYSSVLASSSNSNDANDNSSNEDREQESSIDEESSTNNDQSPDTQSEQNNSCSNEIIEGPSFIDDDGCPVPCPTLEDQSKNIPQGGPVATPTTTTDSQETGTESSQQDLSQNNSQNPVNTQNNLRPDDATNDVFLDLQLEGVKELPSDSTIFTANSYLKIYANSGNVSPHIPQI